MIESMIWILTTVAAALILGGALFWPRLGLLARLRQLRDAQQRVLVEDALKHLHACEWHGGAATLNSLAGALGSSSDAIVRLVQKMEAQGWLCSSADGLRLTPEGERLTVAVIRAHRLWERYLAAEARMPLPNVHAEAERREHVYDADTLEALDAAMGYPATDPHGDPIPTAGGQLARSPAHPLTGWPLETPARIVHLEDEPAAIYSQIVAEGLCPGKTVRVIEADRHRLTLSDGERVYTLAPLVAANVFVAPHSPEAPPETVRPLTALRPGQRATVCRLDDGLQGFTRRRLLDLGLTPGTAIAAEARGLFGDPTAYRVRGTLVALRRDQAEHILITGNGNDHG